MEDIKISFSFIAHLSHNKISQELRKDISIES